MKRRGQGDVARRGNGCHADPFHEELDTCSNIIENTVAFSSILWPETFSIFNSLCEIMFYNTLR